MENYKDMYPCQVAMDNEVEVTQDSFTDCGLSVKYKCRLTDKTLRLNIMSVKDRKESAALEAVIHDKVFRELCYKCPYREN